MSTKTTFKRIALVAVAALGLGIVSVAPSSAIISGLTVTVNNGGTATIRAGETAKIDSDTTTGASFTVSALHTSQSDTTTVAFYLKSNPSTATSTTAYLSLSDTTTSATRVCSGDRGASGCTQINRNKNGSGGVAYAAATDSTTAGTPVRIVAGQTAGAIGNVGATFNLALDTTTSSGWVAGTYTYTVIATTYSNNGSDSYTVASTSTDVSIVVSKNASQSVAPVAATATAYIGASGTPGADEAVSAVATADTTVDAVIPVKIFNAAGTQTGVQDSITAVVTGAGLISFNDSTYGKSITWAVTDGAATISVRGDGTAGSSSIAISTKSGASWTKTLTFYAKAAKTITATVATPVLALGDNASAVSVAAVDANGTNWTGKAYIVASSAADALVGGSATTPVPCSTWTADDGILCPISTTAVGTAKFKVIDASTVAAATATSNEVTVTVSNAAPASVKLSFDKATYAPFEKATITVTPLDKDGKPVAKQTTAALVTTAGITSNYAFSAGSDTLTAAGGITTSALTGVKKYTVYMPGTGTVTITATGGTALPIAGQVAVTASATVVNSSVDAATDAANEATDAANAATDAALAAADAADAATAAAQDASDAVAALSAQVEKLVASLKAQLTSLTNLVIKIQKKVKA